jgi:hypothetical protein
MVGLKVMMTLNNSRDEEQAVSISMATTRAYTATVCIHKLHRYSTST